MCVTHQACQYTHLARKSMQNTGRNQGETDIHCSFYAELLENKALAFRLSHIQLMIKIRECPHVHFTWLSLLPYLDFISQSINENLFCLKYFLWVIIILRFTYLLRRTMARRVELENIFYES